MDPLLLYALVCGLTILGGMTFYEAVFGGQPNLADRISSVSLASGQDAPPTKAADRLLRWHIRRLRESQTRKAFDRKLTDTLAHAGLRGVESLALFQLSRLALMAAAATVGLTACLLAGKNWLIGLAGGFLLGYIVPTIFITRRARSRQKRILRDLPDALSLMVVSLEAGIAVTEVIRLVGRETSRQGRLFGRELSVTAAQMAAGMSFQDTLKDLADRTGVDEIKSLAALLIQSEKVGARLAPALRANAQLLNSRRRMAAEEAARKTSVKMLLPLVFFILPAMLLIILGPAAVQLIRMFEGRGL